MGDALSFVLGLLILGVIGVGLVTAARGLNERIAEWRRARTQTDPRGATGGEGGAHEPAIARARADAQALAESFGFGFATREQLDATPQFRQAVDRLRREDPPIDVLVRLGRDGDTWVSRIALAAIGANDDLPADWQSSVVRRLHSAPWDQAGLFLRTLERVPGEVIGPVLAHLDDVVDDDAAALVANRMANGLETVDVDLFRRHVPRSMTDGIEALVDEHAEIPDAFRDAFEEWRSHTVDEAGLEEYGRLWQPPYDSPPALLVGRREELAEAIVDELCGEPPRSVMLVGEHGVGKTALVRAALDELPDRWLAFEATASSVNAGAMYVGQLEGRVEELVTKLRGQRTVWVFPEFQEALYAGQYAQSPTGLLDALLPHVEAGDIRIVAEISPSAYESLVAQRPRVASAFETFRVRPLPDADAIAVARHALEHDDVDVDASDQVLTESLELAQQFLPGAAPPGNLLRLIGVTVADAAERDVAVIETTDVLAMLASLSGLPLALLDASKPLPVDVVRAFFAERLLGQEHAVECVVERIALIKAGLTDPTRPLGVFLFVGPTGTGKTELAKALAEFLFGSAQRLVRLDMTEYQTPDSLERLLADTSLEHSGAPLIAAVRKDPFAVILLDEFEKAAQPIWDLFLQVFDDGRLTDKHGRTADFRRSVIILTSNVGSSIAAGPGLGFERRVEPFRPEQIERALSQWFRPEFLNRIDRVVVFRPFERAQMRALLEKELDDVVKRRGLRGRPWAVELDESAIAFLIDEGFTPHLGARPLKRAVEQHLLGPLARAIVEDKVPEGDQFLFVTASRGALEVTFVDPDAPPHGEDRGEADADVTPQRHDLRAIALRADSDPAALRLVHAELRRVTGVVASEAVQERKARALAAINSADFWEDDDRFEVLAEAEYLDRLEAATRTAERLGTRLGSLRSDAPAAELVSLLASRLYVLDRALEGLDHDSAHEAFVALRQVGSRSDESDAFVASLREMYLAWGERRGMTITQLVEDDTQVILAVSGLGAAEILEAESGLHILESVTEESSGDRSVDRTTVAVQVVPWVPGPSLSAKEIAARARSALATEAAPPTIVRRYRFEPAPLVRDAVRGYRTGRIDRVLGGDFDLY